MQMTKLPEQGVKCKICWDKGYSTQWYGTRGAEDFGGEGFETPLEAHKKYCTCELGQRMANPEYTKSFGTAESLDKLKWSNTVELLLQEVMSGEYGTKNRVKLIMRLESLKGDL